MAATTPSMFFGETVTDAELSYLVANMPKGFSEWKEAIDGTANASGQKLNGTKANEIIYLGANDSLGHDPGGYDIVVAGQDVNLSKSGFEAVQLTGAGNYKVTGSAGSDDIVGNSGNNTLSGGAGNDVIVGLGGNDSISGGSGNDKLFGDVGNDSIGGGDGNDKLFGGDGLDTLRGGNGNDIIDGGAGNDSIFGDAGNDQLLGGVGDDTISGGTGDDKVDGGVGNDSIFGDAGSDQLLGGLGNDIIDGGAGNDLLKGLAGDDQLFGGAGRDTIFGGDGNDIIRGGAGSDQLFGGAGHDTFVFATADALKGDVDQIMDFRAGEDVIDLSQTSAVDFDSLKIFDDGLGNVLIKVEGEKTAFKLIGFDKDEINSDFFTFKVT